MKFDPIVLGFTITGAGLLLVMWSTMIELLLAELSSKRSMFPMVVIGLSITVVGLTVLMVGMAFR